MALPASGSISLSDVNVELGSPSSTTRALNDAAVRTLFGVASGTISMSNGYGKSNTPTYNLTISANTNDYNIRSAAISAGWPGSVDANVNVTINPGVFVGSTSTGSSAFSIGSPWPAGSALTVTNNGTIVGRGGGGGNGGTGGVGPPVAPKTAPGSAGGAGGPAFNTGRAVTVTNNGTISGGGGGGGGGGGAYRIPTSLDSTFGGGGGGGGIGGSSGGTAGTGQAGTRGGGAGQDGQGGTVSSAGGGGAGRRDNQVPGPTGSGSGGSGGAGGSGGSSGQNSSQPPPGTVRPGGGGGSAGAAVTGNPFITWPATGTRNGPIS